MEHFYKLYQMQGDLILFAEPEAIGEKELYNAIEQDDICSGSIQE